MIDLMLFELIMSSIGGDGEDMGCAVWPLWCQVRGDLT